jgi:GNAT superfamily N-acetyltransferase
LSFRGAPQARTRNPRRGETPFIPSHPVVGSGFLAYARPRNDAVGAFASKLVNEMAQIEIRPVSANDRDAWEVLWHGYQAFYQRTVTPEVTETTWRRLHDPAEPVHVLGAYLAQRLVGIAHYVYLRSTLMVEKACYLQDLFTDEAARGQGVGRSLIEGVYDRARAVGAGRVYWLTHESNATARALYDKVAERSGFIQYRKLF